MSGCHHAGAAAIGYAEPWRQRMGATPAGTRPAPRAAGFGASRAAGYVDSRCQVEGARVRPRSRGREQTWWEGKTNCQPQFTARTRVLAGRMAKGSGASPRPILLVLGVHPTRARRRCSRQREPASASAAVVVARSSAPLPSRTRISPRAKSRSFTRRLKASRSRTPAP